MSSDGPQAMTCPRCGHGFIPCTAGGRPVMACVPCQEVQEAPEPPGGYVYGWPPFLEAEYRRWLEGE